MTTKQPTLTVIAGRIEGHLARMEAAKGEGEVNAPRYYVSSRTGKRERSSPRFWMARAFRAGSRVGVIYVSYQGKCNLTKAEALTYLAWLDAGHEGTHREQAS